MVWVAFGLEYYIRFQSIKNVNSENLVIESVGWITLARAATYVPDIFFFVAAFLNFKEMYVLIKEVDEDQENRILGNNLLWK
jgi:hypothetical protein